MRLILMLSLGLTIGCNHATAVTIANVAEAGSSQGVDWPCFLGPNQDSTSPEKGIRTKWPSEGLPIVWETELGIGYAPPVISKGKLFHFDRFGDQARLTARDSKTGKLLWKYEYPTNYEDQYGYDSGPRCSPTVDDDRVYLHGVEGMLTCVDVASGKQLWQIDTRKEYSFRQNFFGVGSCPIVEGELLIVPIGGSDQNLQVTDFRALRGNGTGIVAFDKKTGQVKWKTSDALGSYSSPVIRSIAGQRRGLYFSRNTLISFSPVDGKIDFEFPWRSRILESVNASNPTVINDQIFVTECYEKGGALIQWANEKPKVIWTDSEKDRDEKSLACHWNTPIHVDGYLYGSSGRHESQAELRCIRLKDGEVMWSKRGLSRTSLMMVDGHFLCLGERGVLSILKINPEKYQEVATWKLPDLRYPTWAAPVLSHGLLYLRGEGRLICCELISKKPSE
jgi:outer membrane protein assembly factor BamB